MFKVDERIILIFLKDRNKFSRLFSYKNILVIGLGVVVVVVVDVVVVSKILSFALLP